MRRVGGLIAGLGVCCLLILAPGTAGAAVRCKAPGSNEDWRAVDPAEAGMDEQGIRDAIALGTENGSFAIRVYRYGCRVGEDDAAEANRNTQYESWSLAKSVTVLVFGRAMTLGLAGPDDPLGSLIEEADQAHGEITLRHLLTMTSGLRWNGFRDYNIVMPDRLHEALTVPVESSPAPTESTRRAGPRWSPRRSSARSARTFRNLPSASSSGRSGSSREAGTGSATPPGTHRASSDST